MKMTKKILSVLLATVMLFSAIGCTTVSFAATDTGEAISEAFMKGFGKALGMLIDGILGGLNLPIKNNPKFVSEEDYELTDFYAGNDEFLDAPGENNVWKLGSSSVSLVPTDYTSHKYYIGGFIGIENGFTNLIEDVADDMKARVIAIDDNSGRGVSLFATVDCIGMTNNDIKVIRRLAAERFAKEYPEAKIASINVFSTHCHSCVDTEGLWTNLFGKIFGNLFKSALSIPMETGTDPAYMDFMSNRVALAMVNAYGAMKEGTLTYSVKDIGEGYFSNKNRSSCSNIDTRLTRLMFTPADGSRATVIVNLGAHPDVAGLPMSDGVNKGRTVSGDYVYYIGEYLNNCGYDFMFFNGAICGIYFGRGLTNDNQDMTYRWEQSRRYGYEIAKMTLAMNKTLDEIKADPALYDQALIDEELAMADKNGGGYTLWCDGWTPVDEVEVDPFFNIKLGTAEVPITNNLIKMAGKLNLANYSVIKCGWGKYKINVEIGYIEFGNQLKVCMVPGEFCADLRAGGNSLTAEGSFSGTDFDAPTLYDLFGDVTVFGLANDAIGYIVPDNDFSKGIIDDHYQELISLGQYTASSIMHGFEALSETIG